VHVDRAPAAGVNSITSVCRLVCDTQPPQPRVFADALAARNAHGSTQVVLTSLDPIRRGSMRWLRASNYGIYGDAGRYYACMALDLSPTPAEFRSGQVVGEYQRYLGEFIRPAEVERVIASNPAVDRLIVWERYERFKPPDEMPADDEIRHGLGDGWRLAQPAEIFWLRSWHTWGDMGWMRRREFTRRKSGL
jgi:hypothetical protein